MGMDRLEYENTGVTELTNLTRRARAFLDELGLETGVPIQFAGTGFGTLDTIHLTNKPVRDELIHA
jgi:adenylosuccinate synthase